MLKIKVQDQVATMFNDRQIVSDAVNFVPIQFEFNDRWNDLDKTYQFSNGNVNIDVVTNETTINIPAEVLITGKLAVKIRGVKLTDNGSKIDIKATTNPVYYNVIASQLTVANNSQPVLPEVKEQIRQIAERANMTASNTLEKVVTIENHIYILLQIKDDVVGLKDDVTGIKDEIVGLVDDAKASELNIKATENSVRGMIDTFTTDEENRVLAEQSRVETEQLRQQWIEGVNESLELLNINVSSAVQNANAAATNANNAKDNIQSQYNNLAGAGRTSETVKGNADKINSKIKTSIFTASVNGTTNIVHGLSFDSAKDDMVVMYKGIQLYSEDPEKNFTFNANKVSIDLDGWSIGVGEKVRFKVSKDVK